MTHWSNEKVFQLIELYRINRLMWDPMLKDYKSKSKKYATLQDIAEQINTPAIEVEKKIHVLRSQFSREKKKTVERKSVAGSCGVQEPKWIFYDALKFLLSGDTVSASSDTTNTDEEKVIHNDNYSLSLEIPPSPLPPPTPTSSLSTREINVDDFYEDVEKVTKRADSCKGYEMRSTHAITDDKRDEFELFGAYIASELRLMGNEKAVIEAKHQINNVIYKLRMEVYNRNLFVHTSTMSN